MLSKISSLLKKKFPGKTNGETPIHSFAYRIAVSTMVRRLFLLIQLNILFFIFGFLWTIVIAEQNVEEAYQDWLRAETPKAARCLIQVQNYEGDGLKLPGFAGKQLEGTTEKGARVLNAGPSLSSFLFGMTYDAYIPLDGDGDGDGSLHISYYMGVHLVSALEMFPLILFFQLIFWLIGYFPALRSARLLLQPLHDMTLSARALHRRVQSPGDAQRYSRRNLELLAGDIKQLGARQDAKLWVKDLELKGLAEAINHMLEQVHESYWQQSQFVSDASHELRTPIAVIEGYANILDRWGKNDEKTLLESIKAIKSESARLKDLVEQLLFLARGDNENMIFQWYMLNIVSLVEDVIRGAQVVDEKHGWRFTVEPVYEAVYLRGDEGLLRQALRILIDNAIRYSPEGREIALKVSAQPDSVRISVQDQGIGIAPQDIPRIFDRFFRSEASRSRKVGGTGLGLSIAKWIVEKHKGRIGAQSHEGAGTCITVELPRNWDGGFS
jgi:signal transduction histidine kinase